MTATAQKKGKAPKVTSGAAADGGEGWDIYDDRPALTEDEIAKLLTAPTLGESPTKYQRLMYYRDLVLMGLLYDTKARIGELCKATVGDLRRMSTAEPELYIRFPKGKVKWRRIEREEDAEPGWHLHWRTVKGTKELWAGPTVLEPRYAGISPRTKQHLDLYLDLRDDGSTRTAPLLISKHGKLSPRGAQYVLREYAKRVGLTIKYRAETDTDGEEQLRLAVSPHAFREAGERHQLDRGANAKAVAEETGHSVATQQQYYNRVNRESVRNAQRLTNPFYHSVPGESTAAPAPAAPPAPAAAAPQPPAPAPPAPVAPTQATSVMATLLTPANATIADVAGLQEFAQALGVGLRRIATPQTLFPVGKGEVIIAAAGAAFGETAPFRMGLLSRLQQEGARLFVLEEGGEVDVGQAEVRKRLAASK